MRMVHRHKKSRPNLLWNLPPSFMGDDYLTSTFFVVLASSLGVSFGISTSSIPSQIHHDIRSATLLEKVAVREFATQISALSSRSILFSMAMFRLPSLSMFTRTHSFFKPGSCTLHDVIIVSSMLMAGAVAFICYITSVLNKVSSKKLLNQSGIIISTC